MGEARMRQFVFGMLMAAFAVNHPVTAKPVISTATIVSSFDFQGLYRSVQFCYDQQPEFIYFRKTDSGKTAVESRFIDGRTTTLFELPGPGDENSLSCSVDGSTIAALNTTQDRLYILKASQLSIYKFDRGLFFSVRSSHSLLSPDGSTISVPGDPIHVSGPDVLKQMRFLKTKTKVYFEGGSAYLDEDRSIDLYQYGDDGWKRQRSIAKPAGFYVNEISRCGSRVLASLGDDNNARFLSLDEPSKGRADWLKSIGVRGLLGAFSDHVKIGGAYGRCVFPLLGTRDVRNIILGIVTFDNEATHRFSIAASPLSMSDDDIHLSKDGCHALISAFKQVPNIPEFTMAQQTILLKLGASACK
jgi:hypothetical protein